jgi:polysaccharide export outer membrane protein
MFFSCIPQSKIILMQYDQLNDSVYANDFVPEVNPMMDYLIQPNDYLYISITTVEKSISEFLQPLGGANFLDISNQALIGYHVGDDSTVLFPYLGKIKVAGMTVTDAHVIIKDAATLILGDRVRVDVKLINNVINVIGEVNDQGLHNMTKNKITIFEAITIAGGLTDFAKRKKVKVFRVNKGVKEVFQVDVTSGKTISDNMFYCFPNDIVYVEPMRAKSFGLTPTFSLSVLTTLLSAYLLIVSVTK